MTRTTSTTGRMRALVTALIWAAALPAGAASFTVDTTVDLPDLIAGDGSCDAGAGSCSLRAAIQETNALAGADEILLPAGTFLLSRPGANENDASTGDLDLLEAVAIRGAGRQATLIDGGQLDRVFDVDPASAGIEVVITDLTVRNGTQGIVNRGDLTAERVGVESNGNLAGFASGAGIENVAGSLHLLDSVVAANVTGSHGGGLFLAGDVEIRRSEIRDNVAGLGGGGIYNLGSVLHVEDSEIHGNSSRHNANWSGGGIFNETNLLTVVRTTIHGNDSPDCGGGLYNEGGNAILSNSTISGNSADNCGGGIGNTGSGSFFGRVDLINVTISANDAPTGGGLANAGTLTWITVHNSILAGNGPSADCGGTTGNIESRGHNLGSDASCLLDEASDRQNTDAVLSPLADNGGPAPTHALSVGSPAIEAAEVAACPAVDQRGQSRFAECGGCDIGAYEAAIPLAATFTVTKEADTNDGSCNADCSLREAIVAANAFAGRDVIWLPAGRYELSPSEAGGLHAENNVYLFGEGADSTVIDAAGAYGVLSVSPKYLPSPPIDLFVCDLTVSGGNATEGGGIFARGGRVTLQRATLSNNSATVAGGGLAAKRLIAINNNVNSPVVILDSIVEDNFAPSGGGAWVGGGEPSIILRSVIRNNRASTGSGAGLWINTGGSIRHSTFSGNVVTSGLGGGMAVDGGELHVINSTFSDNRADAVGLDVTKAFGGGIALLGGTLHARNATIAGNRAQAVRDDLHFAGGPAGSSATLENTILSACSGTAQFVSSSIGYNILPSACVTTLHPTDLFVRPELEPLTDNGGPTETRAPRLDSPAIDGGNPAGCSDVFALRIDVDQRGAQRSGRCDIGAFQLGESSALLDVVLAGDGAGRVLGSAVGIDCGGACSAADVYGPVRLQATPDPGSCFAGWSGDAECDDGAPVIENGNVTCVAEFIPAPTGSFLVNSTIDAGDADPGDGICETAPGNGICTLRAAIDQANVCGGRPEIVLPAGTFTLTRSGRLEDGNATGDLDIRNGMRVIGAGQDATFIDGNDADRIFDICPFGSCDSTTVVDLEQLTVRNGRIDGLFDLDAAGGNDCCGGSILNMATTSLTDCTVADGVQDAYEHSVPGDAGNRVGEAGGIATHGGSLTLMRTKLTGHQARAAAAVITSGQSALTMIDSLVSNNHADFGTGGVSSKKRTIIIGSTIEGNAADVNIGGLRLDSPTDLINSTVSGNSAPQDAGIRVDGPLNVINSTIAANVATVAGNCGGLCRQGGTVTFRNSIIADNGINCVVDAGDVISLGYNIESDDDCSLDQASDRVDTDPLLAPLADNGGRTPTHALLPGSPAIDGGDPSGCVDAQGVALVTDQRGRARPIDGVGDAIAVCDAGSFELSPNAPPVPDGGVAGGSPIQVGLSADGSTIEVSWDVSSCVAGDYNVMIGPLVPHAPLVVDQAVCGVGTSGNTEFAAPEGSVMFLIVSSDGNGLEGPHGYDSQGVPRSSDGIGVCGITGQVASSTCAP